MTTIDKRKLTCTVCGATNEFSIVMSTNAFGSQDLDLRPPEMERSTIIYNIQRCPECGYCASSVSDNSKKPREFIESADYRAQLHDKRYPELANTYLCASMISENSGDLVKASWKAMNAAWVCDDVNLEDGARDCRKQTLRLLQMAENKGETLGTKAGIYIVMAEVMRRANLTDNIQQMLEKASDCRPNEVESKIISYLTELVRLDDDRIHTVQEALEFNHFLRKGQ